MLLSFYSLQDLQVSSSQLVVALLATEIRHRHDLDDQARPASEMLCSLASSGLRIVLLPRKARLLEGVVDCIDKVPSEGAVHRGCSLLLWSSLLGGVLDFVSNVQRRLAGILALTYSSLTIR